MANVWKIPEALAHQYHGAGPGLVAVTGGQVVALRYLEDVLPGFDPDDSHAVLLALSDDRLGNTVRQLQTLGEVSVVMLGSWEAVEL